MRSIELLTGEARAFEQDEQWGKALDLYSQGIDQLSADDNPDIALFNRAGDLATKIGSAAQAVAFYERAVDFYMDTAMEFYDRVFALDINFADVTERLRVLRD